MMQLIASVIRGGEEEEEERERELETERRGEKRYGNRTIKGDMG